MASLVQDLRYGLRTLAHSPGFTAVAVAALTLGIGANTAIFSVVNGVLLQPLPYHEPDRLMELSERTREFSTMSVAYLNFVDWMAQNRSFSGMAAIRWNDYDLTGAGEAEHLRGKMVSADFFRVLGIAPVLGRDFDPNEDRLGSSPVAVISGGFWQRRFGGRRDIVGRQLRLDSRNYTIIGVTPAGFRYRGNADVYTLMGQWDDIMPRSREMHPGIFVIARLSQGVASQRAQADMDAVSARLAQAYPKSNDKHGVNLKPLTQVIVGDVRGTLMVLLGAVGFVLLIACANVANLLLARSAGRHREMAVRAAIGASRGRIVRQLLTESIVLALAGGVAGLALAKWGARAVLAAVPGGVPRSENIGIDGWVLGFTLAVSLLTGVLFGLTPALQVSLSGLHEALKEGARGSTSGRHRLRSLLVVSEVAAALVLLVGAGLMLRTMWQLNAVDPGFRTGNLLTFSVGLSPSKSDSEAAIVQQLERIMDRVRHVPGVESSAFTSLLPLSDNDSEMPYYVEGRPRPASQADTSWALGYITDPRYLKTMGIPLLRGRYLTPADTLGAMRVVVIDEVLAKAEFPNQDAVGQNLRFADMGGSLGEYLARPMRIVGVVGHVNHWGLDRDASARIRSQMYLSVSQVPAQFLGPTVNGSVFVVRTRLDAGGVAPAVRLAAGEAGGNRPVYDVRSMDDVIAESIAGRRFSMLLLGIFAALALVLALVGIYGVISYAVVARTHEIGIRMALGARPGQVLRDVMVEGMVPVLAGLGIGLVAALVLTRLMSGLLYGVKSSDPITFTAVAILLAAVALAASYIPARRATTIDPTLALRHD